MISDLIRPAIQDAEIKRLLSLLEQAQPLLAAEVKTASQEFQAATLAETIRRELRNGKMKSYA